MNQLHLAQYERMAADRALAKDHQVPRKDIRPFDRNRNGCRQPHAAEVVTGAHDDAFAAMDIHGVGDALAAALGQVIFENRRQH